MGIKAWLQDDDGTPHMLIGLNRQDLESIEAGEVFRLPAGMNVPTTEKTEVVVMYEATDKELVARMKSGTTSAGNRRHKHRKS